jgi:hypothetical protein
MKPSNDHDFTISVRRESWELSEPIAVHFEDAFRVRLNFQLLLRFIPRVERSAGPWPPIPMRVDLVTSPDEAHRALVAMSNLVVTPDDERAETVELSNIPDFPDEHRVVFFVSGQQFEAFRRELDHLSEERPAVYEGWRVSEIPDSALAKFLLERFLTSGHLTDEELDKVGRS